MIRFSNIKLRNSWPHIPNQNLYHRICLLHRFELGCFKISWYYEHRVQNQMISNRPNHLISETESRISRTFNIPCGECRVSIRWQISNSKILVHEDEYHYYEASAINVMSLSRRAGHHCARAIPLSIDIRKLIHNQQADFKGSRSTWLHNWLVIWYHWYKSSHSCFEWWAISGWHHTVGRTKKLYSLNARLASYPRQWNICACGKIPLLKPLGAKIIVHNET